MRITGTLFLILLLCFTCNNLFSAQVKPTFVPYDPGTEVIVNYDKYGTFENSGSEKYKYVISDPENLKKAVGEGIFPNSGSIIKDPEYQKKLKDGELEGNRWDFVDNDNHQANFFKWATAAEEPGVKLFCTALALERSGNIAQAIKAYYAVVVSFPKSVGRTYWNTPLYIGTMAVNKIKYLTRNNPQLGMKLAGAYVKVKNHFDDDTKNDVFIVNPGKLVKATAKEIQPARQKISSLTVLKTIGKGNVKLTQYTNKHWQYFVNGLPFYIHGMAYSPNKIGLSPDAGTLDVSRDWMFADYNKNGVIDGPYEAWVDANRNNKQDPDEKNVGDFQLMKDMGVNTLRIYQYKNLNKQLLKEGYEKYGFMYMMGNLLGMYCSDSGADWFNGTDYSNPEQCKKMLDSVKKMVEEYKEEPYILMWVLGNENNYGAPGTFGQDAGSGCRAKLQPEAYYKFVNEAAKLVKSIDPEQRPVAVCNGDTLFLDICAKSAPALDVFGVNCYRGAEGFGTLWEDVSETFDKPVVVTEYGCSALHELWDQKRSEQGQAAYHRGNWDDMELNFAGAGFGNALGGVCFEWTDEWWKANADLPDRVKMQKMNWYMKREKTYHNLKPDTHDSVPQFGAPFLDGWSYEEWLGITSVGDGTDSPFMRQLRPAYYVYKELWNKKVQ